MDKTQNKRMSTKKKTFLFIATLPVGLILYFVVTTYLVSPIQDSYDKLRFDQLNTQMNKVYNQVLATAGDDEQWKYDTSCRYDSEDIISIGQGYRCTMKLSTIAIRTDIADTDKLHQKYYPIVNSTTFITAMEPILINSYNDIKRGSFVKDAYARYSSSIDESVECSYFIQGDTLGSTFGFYGSPERFKELDDNTEVTTQYFKCEIHSNQDWYAQTR